MDPNSLAIPIAFILLAAVLCLLLIGSKWKWWQKLLLILIVPSFGLAVWKAIDSYKGWPIPVGGLEALPQKSLIYWGIVHEPSTEGGSDGFIDLWLLPLDEESTRYNPLDYDPSSDQPRSYRLPYSRSMHDGLVRARDMILRGGRPALDRSGKGHGDGDGSGGEGSGSGSGYGYDPDREDFQIYAMPPSHPPAKIPEHDPVTHP